MQKKRPVVAVGSVGGHGHADAQISNMNSGRLVGEVRLESIYAAEP
jgi:hypothetical protein